MTLSFEPNRPICNECVIRPAKKGPKSVYGYQTWTNLCGSCNSKKYRKARIVNLVCTICGFKAEDGCQIDTVDNKSICSNCNRIRVKRNKQNNSKELTVDSTVSSSSDFRL